MKKWSIFLLLILSSAARAEDPQLTTLQSDADADAYVSQIQSKYSPVETKIIVNHVGDSIPGTLRRAAIKLSKLGFEVEIHSVTGDEIRGDLERSLSEGARAVDEISYSDDGRWNADEEAALKSNYLYTLGRMGEVARQVAGSLTGVTGGISLWITIKRDEAIEKFEKALGQKQGKFALGSLLGVSIYAKVQDVVTGVTTKIIESGSWPNAYDLLYDLAVSLETGEKSIVAPAIVLGAWVYVNIFYSRNINAFNSQGKMLAENVDPATGRSKWVVKAHPIFMSGSIFLRSIMTNTLVVTAAYVFTEPSTLLEASTGAGILSNAAFSLATRYAFEAWLAERQALISKDGTVLVSKTHHTPQETAKIRDRYEFWNGIFKNLNLLNVPYVKWIFPAYGAVMTAYLMGKNYKTYTHKVKDLPRMFRKSNLSECASVFNFVPR